MQIMVYAPTAVAFGHFGVAGGEFTWALIPSVAPGITQYHLVAWPTGGVQASRDGTF